MHTHHGLYDDLFEIDEQNDADRHHDLRKAKLTFTECIIALAISIALVTLIAIGLVEQIEPVVEKYGVSDAFMGLILVPIVEKAAEHLTASMSHSPQIFQFPPCKMYIKKEGEANILSLTQWTKHGTTR